MQCREEEHSDRPELDLLTENGRLPKADIVRPAMMVAIVGTSAVTMRTPRTRQMIRDARLL